MTDEEVCPNCGSPYMEKIAFTHGISIWRETDEICLFEREDGTQLLFLHLNGGDGTGVQDSKSRGKSRS